MALVAYAEHRGHGVIANLGHLAANPHGGRLNLVDKWWWCFVRCGKHLPWMAGPSVRTSTDLSVTDSTLCTVGP